MRDKIIAFILRNDNNIAINLACNIVDLNRNRAFVLERADNYRSVKPRSVFLEKEFKFDPSALRRNTRCLASVTLTYLTRETAFGGARARALIIYRVVIRAACPLPFWVRKEREREKKRGEIEPRTFRVGRTTGPEITFPTVKRESTARKPNWKRTPLLCTLDLVANFTGCTYYRPCDAIMVSPRDILRAGIGAITKAAHACCNKFTVAATSVLKGRKEGEDCM